MDYDLGRAHGKVVITADTRDATRAMADYERSTESATKAAGAQSRIEQELTERRRVSTEAAIRRKEAEAEYKRVMADSTSTVEQQIEAEQRRNKALSEHLQAARKSADAERAMSAHIAGNTQAVNKFINSLDRSTTRIDAHTSRMRSMRSEADKLASSMSSLGGTMASVFGTIAKGLAVTGGIGAAGGLGALLGAGGIQGTMSALGGLASIIAQFSGSLLLIPGAVAGAVTAISTLAIAFNGVGDALKSMDDPAKFVESLGKLGPATREFVLEIYQFRDVFRGFKQTIQDGLFAPLIKEIDPLVRSLLPTLMDGMRNVANSFGEIGAGFAQFLRAPETVEAISVFLSNMASSLKAILPGLNAFGSAMRTLSTVGSSFFPMLAQSFNSVATQFNNWIDKINASGQLQEWIQNGINAFSSLARTVRDFGIALMNIFQAATNGGGALTWLENLAATFRSWTESVAGDKAISGFFAKVREATDALMPILKVVGSALAAVISSLTDTGIGAQSGLLSFFTSIGDGLKIFADSIKASGPQLGGLLDTIGKAFLEIAKSIGPQLPGLFQSFGEVLKTIAPVIATVVEKVIAFIGSLSPDQLQFLLTATVALVGLGAALGPLAGLITTVTTVIGACTAAFSVMSLPVLAVVAVIAALVAAGVLLYMNWDTVKEKASQLWEGLKMMGSWIAEKFTAIWTSLAESISGAWEDVKSAVSTAIDSVKELFTSMAANALQWGTNLIKNLGEGILNAVPGLRGVVDWVAKLFPDSWLTESPAKRGPLSKVSPNQMGINLVKNLTEGVKSASPMALKAADGVASGVSQGFTGGSNTNNKSRDTTGGGSAGTLGGPGESGLQNFVKGITGELSAWGRIFQSVTQITLGLVDMAVSTVKIIGSLWNDGKGSDKWGDNVMTRPGGILSDQQKQPEMPEQKFVDGIPHAKQMKEDEEFAKPIPAANPDTYMPRGKAGKDAAAEATLPKQKDVAPIQPTITGGPGKSSSKPAKPVRAPYSMQSAPSPGLSSSRYGATPNRFFVHTEDGNQGGPDPAGLADWMKAQGDRSYHYIVNDDGSIVVNPVSTDQSAWSVGPEGNSSSINAVFGGSWADWTRDDWIGKRREAIRSMASLAVSESEKYGFPADLLADGKTEGIGGHGWVTDNLGGTDHTDPGPGFPWDIFKQDIDAARGIMPPLTGPVPGDDGYVEAGKMKGGGGGLQTFGPRKQGPPGKPSGPGKPTKDSSDYELGANINVEYGAAGFPRWVYQLGDMFGVEASTYASHQTDGADGHIPSGPVNPNPNHSNRGIDWRPKGLDIFSAEGSAVMEKFMTYLRDNELAEQVIYQGITGNQIGFPLNSDYSGNYPDHQDHGHTRFGKNLSFGKRGGPHDDSRVPAPAGSIESVPVYGEDNGVKLEVITPKPLEVNQKLDSVPEYGKGKDGTPLIPITPPAGSTPPADDPARKRVNQLNLPDVASNAGGGTDIGGGGIAAVAQGGGTQAMSVIDQISGIAGDVGTIVGDAFQVFNDVITNIDAAADLTATAARGVENTEDIYKSIDQIQTFISTAADVAKLTSSAASTVSKYVGAGASADTSGSTAAVAAAFGAAGAIAGLVQTGLETTNAVIDLGQEAYRMMAKYGAKMKGMMLGGPETGPLGGNVRMMLNTNTGQIISYSEDNALNKSTKDLPAWFAKAYGGNTQQQPTSIQQQLNLYTGAGSDPKNLIADTMWLANYGGASVVSVAGRD